MRKTLNLQASAMTDEAKAFMLGGGADSLVLWAPQWAKLEPQHGEIDDTQWTALDANVHWAHGKLDTFIAVPSGTTPWLPRWDATAVSYWPAYLKRILERYPHTTVIVQNEPDYAGISALTSALLMRAAARCARGCGHERILGPGTATLAYATKVIGHLRGWTPPDGVQVGFAHHQYIDVGHGSTAAARALLMAMRMCDWQDGQHLWLTEGGYIYPTWQGPRPDYGADPATWHYREPLAAQERRQLDNVTKHYQWAKDNGHVEMWAQYEYRSSLWAGWASGIEAYDGTPHPLYHRWKDL